MKRRKIFCLDNMQYYQDDFRKILRELEGDFDPVDYIDFPAFYLPDGEFF